MSDDKTYSGFEEHQLMVRWAADCAAHVLKVFEESTGHDMRVRLAIEAAEAWSRGEITTGEARKFAFAAHAAAREAINPKAQFAARSAAHAAATAHVQSHAKHAANYALKASNDPTKERSRQLSRFQEIFKAGL